ncbi:MAG: hypothetical protein U1G05_07360 [Kiritimatiellia bacterium]
MQRSPFFFCLCSPSPPTRRGENIQGAKPSAPSGKDSSPRKGGEAGAALELTARYAREGGDPYLASLRTAWLRYSQ